MRRIIAILTFMMGAVLSVNSAKAVNFDPGDYYAAPPGTNLAIIYSGYLGDVGDTNADLNANINIARFVWYREFLGITVDPQFLLPFGHQDLEVGGADVANTTGLADPILAATFWLYNTKETQFAITPFLFVPWGDYDAGRVLNFGENRTKFALQAGYIKLMDKWLFEAAADVTFHGDNDHTSIGTGVQGATLEQDETYEFRLSARYSVSPKLSLAAQVAYTIVGETTLAGVKQNDDNEILALSGYVQYMLQPDLQLQLKYDRQVDRDKDGPVGNVHNAEVRLVKIY